MTTKPVKSIINIPGSSFKAAVCIRVKGGVIAYDLAIQEAVSGVLSMKLGSLLETTCCFWPVGCDSLADAPCVVSWCMQVCWPAKKIISVIGGGS